LVLLECVRLSRVACDGFSLGFVRLAQV